MMLVQTLTIITIRKLIGVFIFCLNTRSEIYTNLATIHEDELGVTAGGYSLGNSSGATAIDPSATIYASQVIESSQRRFITDAERYAIATLQLNGMLKDTYDTDNDGIVDVARNALTATRATHSDTAGTATNATYATTAERADEADHATIANKAEKATSADRADIADKSIESDHSVTSESAKTANESTHALNADHAITSDHSLESDNAVNATNAEHALDANHADTADTADHAVTADTATKATTADKADEATVALSANSVDWDNIENKPTDFVKKEDLTWEAIKDSAPDIINNTTVLNTTIESLQSDSHAHFNMESLNKISSDVEGNPTWNGNKWPSSGGDMKKTVYDADGDGIVDRAKTVNWGNITNLPNKFTPTEHTHNPDEINQNYMNRFVTDVQIATWNNKQEAIGFTPENSEMKGLANGYASLDTDGKVPEEQLHPTYWERLENKPESSVEDIDDAVNKKHSHVNAVALDKLSVNDDNKPIWDGVEWPYTGDMHKEVYDVDDDGIIDHAKIADTVTWSGITNKPVSTVSDIDEAVSKKHAHTNINALNLLDKDENNNPLWNNDNWPYDMKKSVYDTDSDGVVDEAEFARAVEWSGIRKKPVSTIEDIDDSVSKAHEHSNLSALENLDNNPSEERLSYKGKDIAFIEDIAAIPTPSGEIQAKHSVEVDVEDLKIHLVNDDAFPDPNKYYGTNNDGVRGYHNLPTPINYNATGSIILDSDNNFKLRNDSDPTEKCYYGTDQDGNIGYHKLPEINISSLEASKVIQDETHRFITSEQLEKLSEIINKNDNPPSEEEPENPPVDPGENDPETPEEPTIDEDTITGAEALCGVRECIVSAMDNFFILDGSDLIIKASEEEPLVVSFSNGKTTEIIKKVKSNITVVNVPSVINEGAAYIYLTLEDNEVKAHKTSLKPIFSYNKPESVNEGTYWFNINTYTMFKYETDKFIETETPVLFIGEVHALSGKVTKIPYSFNGMYDSGWFEVSYGTVYNKAHNLGTDLVSVIAYRGLNGVNMGEFAFAVHGSSITEAIAIGDRVSKVTENNVQTTRYSVVPYGAENVVYANTNQHRVIVKRGW